MFIQHQGISKHQAFTAFIILCGFIALNIFSGCASKRVDTLVFEKTDAPDWVIKSNGAFKEGKERIFYGIGSASSIENYSRLRTTSENRARNEVAKVFVVYMSSLMRDYAASTSAGDFSSSAEEQHVEEAIKAAVTVTLSGVEIIDHWENPEEGILFSLARLNLDEFGKNLETMEKIRGLNSKVRDFVRENAQRVHEDLVKRHELMSDGGIKETERK